MSENWNAFFAKYRTDHPSKPYRQAQKEAAEAFRARRSVALQSGAKPHTSATSGAAKGRSSSGRARDLERLTTVLKDYTNAVARLESDLPNTGWYKGRTQQACAGLREPFARAFERNVAAVPIDEVFDSIKEAAVAAAAHSRATWTEWATALAARRGSEDAAQLKRVVNALMQFASALSEQSPILPAAVKASAKRLQDI